MIAQVNLLAPMTLMREFGPQMAKKHGGHILNVSSIYGRDPVPSFDAYAASKCKRWSCSCKSPHQGS